MLMLTVLLMYSAAGVSEEFTKKMEEWENRKKKPAGKGISYPCRCELEEKVSSFRIKRSKIALICSLAPEVGPR